MNKVPGNIYLLANMICFIFLYFAFIVLISVCFKLAIWVKIPIYLLSFFIFGAIQHKLLVKPIGRLVEKLFFKKYN